jgi:hypothetical protein
MENASEQRTLTIEYYWPHSMACLREGDHVLRYGNLWDFHAGCNGPVLRFADGTKIDFRDEWHDDIRRPDTLAKMVADRIGASIVTVDRDTPFP